MAEGRVRGAQRNAAEAPFSEATPRCANCKTPSGFLFAVGHRVTRGALEDSRPRAMIFHAFGVMAGAATCALARPTNVVIPTFDSQASR